MDNETYRRLELPLRELCERPCSAPEITGPGPVEKIEKCLFLCFPGLHVPGLAGPFLQSLRLCPLRMEPPLLRLLPGRQYLILRLQPSKLTTEDTGEGHKHRLGRCERLGYGLEAFGKDGPLAGDGGQFALGNLLQSALYPRQPGQSPRVPVHRLPSHEDRLETRCEDAEEVVGSEVEEKQPAREKKRQ